jgi:zinc protease
LAAISARSPCGAYALFAFGAAFGVGSGFAYGKGPGAFRTGGDIVSERSDAALVEFMRELRGILGERPVSEEELAVAKDALIQRLPGTFASVGAVNAALTSLWAEGLPDDYYQRYAKSIAAVTRQDVSRVARQHLDLGDLAIVIVGDRATIEAPLAATGIGPIVHLDIDGNPLAVP